MNKQRIAQELVAIARELTALNKRSLVMVSDLHNWTAYFIDSPNKAKDSTDKSAVKSALLHDDTITMGKVVVTPYRFFGSKERRLLSEYGLGTEFEI